jgi:hypothetical protein
MVTWSCVIIVINLMIATFLIMGVKGYLAGTAQSV